MPEWGESGIPPVKKQQVSAEMTRFETLKTAPGGSLL
jgi:hypothetical protein